MSTQKPITNLGLRRRLGPMFMVVLLGIGVATGAAADQQKLTVEALVTKHLESIGTAGARAAMQSRVAQGKVTFTDRITKQLHLDGTTQVISLGPKFKCAMQFGVPQYIGEQLVFNGQEVQVAMTEPGKRSLLGDYLARQPEILREGVFGGTTSTTWLLLDVKSHPGILKYEGLKKIDGRQLHDLTFAPKNRSGSGELTIHLYFDSETFRHMMTAYLRITHVTGGDVREGTEQIIETVEERFGDFRTVDGFTVPMSWDIRYRREPSAPSELQWLITFDQVLQNTLK